MVKTNKSNIRVHTSDMWMTQEWHTSDIQVHSYNGIQVQKNGMQIIQ